MAPSRLIDIDLDPGPPQRRDTIVGQQRRHARRERNRHLELGRPRDERVEVGALEHVAARGDEHRPGRVEAPKPIDEGEAFLGR